MIWRPLAGHLASFSVIQADLSHRFCRVQGQIEKTQPLLEVFKERPRLMFMLEADDGIIRVADDDHVTGRRGAAPAMDPQVIRIMQVPFQNAPEEHQFGDGLSDCFHDLQTTSPFTDFLAFGSPHGSNRVIQIPDPAPAHDRDFQGPKYGI